MDMLMRMRYAMDENQLRNAAGDNEELGSLCKKLEIRADKAINEFNDQLEKESAGTPSKSKKDRARKSGASAVRFSEGDSESQGRNVSSMPSSNVMDYIKPEEFKLIMTERLTVDTVEDLARSIEETMETCRNLMHRAASEESAYTDRASRWFSEFDDTKTRAGEVAAKEWCDYIEVVTQGKYNEDFEKELDGGLNWTAEAFFSDEVKKGMIRYTLGCQSLRLLDVENCDNSLLANYMHIRAGILNDKLYKVEGNSEADDYTGVLVGYAPLDLEVKAINLEADNRMAFIASVVGHHSFLKSGHNVSANGLGHTMMRFITAITPEDAPERTLNPTELGELMGSSMYPALHPADHRLIAISRRRMYSRSELSFSIGRRLFPLGPGTVAQHLLFQVMSQLNDASFFQSIKKQKMYDDYARSFAIYEKTCHLEVPYAKFMYGDSRAENTSHKTKAIHFMAYAKTLDSYMPNSTFNFSVSLKRDSTDAANNSLTAGIEVKAFVNAYRSYLQHLVTAEVRKRLGGRGSSELMALDT
jgi:hypothetical protein